MPSFRQVTSLNILEICELLGIKLKPSGKLSFRGSCPICEHPSTRCFTVTVKLQRFWCHGHCRAGGDGWELYAQGRQLTKRDAAFELQKHFPP